MDRKEFLASRHHRPSPDEEFSDKFPQSAEKFPGYHPPYSPEESSDYHLPPDEEFYGYHPSPSEEYPADHSSYAVEFPSYHPPSREETSHQQQSPYQWSDAFPGYHPPSDNRPEEWSYSVPMDKHDSEGQSKDSPLIINQSQR